MNIQTERPIGPPIVPTNDNPGEYVAPPKRGRKKSGWGRVAYLSEQLAEIDAKRDALISEIEEEIKYAKNEGK